MDQETEKILKDYHDALEEMKIAFDNFVKSQIARNKVIIEKAENLKYFNQMIIKRAEGKNYQPQGDYDEPGHVEDKYSIEK